MIPIGFLRMVPSRFDELENQSRLGTTHEKTLSVEYGPSAYKLLEDFPRQDIFVMERAGHELLYILSPGRSELGRAMVAEPYPSIANLLCGINLQSVSLGFGQTPFRLVHSETVVQAMREFHMISVDQLKALALTNEHLSEVLHDEMSVEKVDSIYWPFLNRFMGYFQPTIDKNLVTVVY